MSFTSRRSRTSLWQERSGRSSILLPAVECGVDRHSKGSGKLVGLGGQRNDGEQLAMLMPPPSRLGDAKAAEQTRSIVESHRARGAGRPPGARNVATRQMLEYLRRHGADPMEERFRWAMHTPETLSKELNCTFLEAFDRLMDLWKDLTRYFYAPMAPVDGEGNAVVPSFAMFIGGAPVGQAGGLPPWMSDPEVRARIEKEQVNQRVRESAVDVSHDGKSHDAPSD